MAQREHDALLHEFSRSDFARDLDGLDPDLVADHAWKTRTSCVQGVRRLAASHADDRHRERRAPRAGVARCVGRTRAPRVGSRAERSSGREVRGREPVPVDLGAGECRSVVVHLGFQAGGESLWWKLIGRNKRPVTLNLSHPKGEDLMRRLLATADVLVENFRPGTLERWNLAPSTLPERLVVVRCTGFGQDGPYARRPGFATLAESMSGLASITGTPDGPPMLPPIALADEVTGLVGTWAAMIALYWRDARGGTGQVIDLSLYESLAPLLGALPLAWDQLRELQPRMGSRLPYAAPRNAYRCADGLWVGLSATAQPVALRVFDAIGRPDLRDDPRFNTQVARVGHAVQLDAIIAGWMSARTRAEALEIFERHDAALAPIYDVSEFMDDPHVRARGSIATVDDPQLGALRMQAVHPRLSASPGRIASTGKPLGACNEEVYGELGVTREELQALRAEGVV